ncbi:MAG: IS110 family transposase, partial [Candidatus Heimdallarchaeota archaeon]
MTQKTSNLKRYAGLDIAKESIFACIVDATGLKVEERFDTKTNDLKKLSIWLKDHEVSEVALENTGIYSEPVIKILKSKYKLMVVNASDTKRSNKKKTDSDDAWWLAELLKAGSIGKGRKIEISYLKDETQTGLKKLTRLRTKYTKSATTHKNRISKIFTRQNIKIFDLFKQNKYTKTSIQIYLAIAEEKSFNELSTDLKEKRNSGTRGEKVVCTRVINFIQKNDIAIKKALKSGVVNELPREDKIELLLTLNNLQLIQDSIQILENEINSIMKSNQQYLDAIEIITTIPGIGEATAPQILAEIPPIEHFSSAEQFSSYSGLTPRISQSAEVRHLGSITKRGPKYLREALYQSAKIASMQKDSSLGKRFSRLYKRKGKGKGKIVWIAIARQITRLIYTLLSRKEKYKDYGYRTKPWRLARKKLERMTIQEISNELKMKNYH